jgi:hypothetical protein
MNNAALNKLHRIEAELRQKHGDKADVSDIAACDPNAILAYGNGYRVRVTDKHGFTRTGRVSRTTGRKPALLLIHRSNASGSWDILSARDRVIAVQHGRRYVAVDA